MVTSLVPRVAVPAFIFFFVLAAVPAAHESTASRGDPKGLIALASILAQEKMPADAGQLAEEFARLEENGLSVQDALVALAKARGLWAYAHFSRIDRLSERLKAGMAVVVQLQTDPNRVQSRTFALVEHYDPTGGIVRVRAGDGVSQNITEGEFWKRWERLRFWLMTAGPPERGTWELSAWELVSRMQFHDSKGNFDAADADGAKALLLDGANPDLCISIAVRERMRGRPDEAEKLFRRAMNKQEGYIRAANNLAYLLAEQGRDLDEAEHLARECVLGESTNPRVLDTLGFVLQAQGRWSDATPIYERAYQRARSMTVVARREIGMRLARAYVHENRRAEAASIVKELLKMDPNLLLPAELAGLEP